MTHILYRTERDSRHGSAIRRLRSRTLPTGEYVEQRGVIASAIALAALTAAATSGGAVAASAIASHGASNAADTQANAASHAADLSSAANAQALAFQRQQAQNQWLSDETTRKANYDQWASRERRLSQIGQMLGLGARDIPGYVASPNPNFDPNGNPLPATATTPNTGTTPAGAESANLSDPTVWMALVGDKSKLASWVTQNLGPAAGKPGLVDYYVTKIQGQPGANPQEQAGSASYWAQKLQNDPNVTGRTSTATPTRTSTVPSVPSIGQAGGFLPTSVAPGVTPQVAYQIGSIGSYF